MLSACRSTPCLVHRWDPLFELGIRIGLVLERRAFDHVTEGHVAVRVHIDHANTFSGDADLPASGGSLTRDGAATTDDVSARRRSSNGLEEVSAIRHSLILP